MVAQATLFRIYLNVLKNNILFCILNEIVILREIITPANIKLNLTFSKLNATRTPSLPCLLSKVSKPSHIRGALNYFVNLHLHESPLKCFYPNSNAGFIQQEFFNFQLLLP